MKGGVSPPQHILPIRSQYLSDISLQMDEASAFSEI